MGGRERRLLSLSMVIAGVSIQSDFANGDQRVVLVRPNFRQVKHIISVFLSVFLWHRLDEPVPAWVITLLDRFKQILSRVLRVLLSHLRCLISGEVLDALASLVVVLDIVNITLIIDPSKGVGSVAIHVAVAERRASIAHKNGDLVESLGRVGPKVKGGIGILQVANGASLLRVDKVGELDGILNEEDGSVIADHVVVTLLSVVLDREATGVTVAVVGTALTSDSREAEEDGGLLSNLVQKLGLAETK